MPVIPIRGLDVEPKLCRELIRQIKKAVASIKALGITEEQVTPFIDLLSIQENPGEVIVAYVDLFDSKKRTPAVRRRVSKAVFETIQTFVVQNKLTEARFIEVIPHRTKPDADGYYSGDAQMGEVKYPPKKEKARRGRKVQ